jgi:AAA family ATPase
VTVLHWVFFLGRIDHILYVAPPDDSAMRAIINIELSRTAHTSDVNADSIIHLVKTRQMESTNAFSNIYSGSDVVSICREAAIAAMEEDVKIDAVHLRHYITAITRVEPRITREMIQFYEEFARNSNLTSVH